jgi:hypothetical protein
MKKIWASIIVLSLMFTVYLATSAVNVSNQNEIEETTQELYNDPQLDLTQYTVDDLLEMSPQELNRFIDEFERVYDPFGSYAKRHGLNK